jgi:hypothetical protein
MNVIMQFLNIHEQELDLYVKLNLILRDVGTL